MKEFLEFRTENLAAWRRDEGLTLSDCGQFLLKNGEKTYEKVGWHGRYCWRLLPELRLREVKADEND